MKSPILLSALLSFSVLSGQQEFLLFNSGFEPDVTGSPTDAHTELAGTDLSVAAPNNWEDLENHPMIGNVDIQYQGGQLSQRYARIIEDPTEPGNHVLKFWLQEPNVELSDCDHCKGRIQMNIFNNNGFYEMRQVNRLYLHEDWEVVQLLEEGFGWMTLSEFWNEGNWYGDEHPFRISLNMIKEAGSGGAFHFGIHGQTGAVDGSGWTTLWSDENTEFLVPVGKWMTFEYIFFEGDADTGRLALTVTVEGEDPVVIFDIHNYTRHPNDPNPDGLTSFNPLKLYTAASTIDAVRQLGVALQVYWDDLAIYAKEYEQVDSLGRLNAGVLPGNRVMFTWNDVMESEQGYRILRKDPQENIYRTFAEVGPNATSYTSAPGEILPYQTYTYTLIAFQGAATYSADNEIVLVMKDAAPPENFTIEAESVEAVSPWEVVNDQEASGDVYLQGTKNSPFARISPPTDGHLQYAFTTNRPNDYQVQIRSKLLNAGTDSFWVRMDENDWTKFETGEPYGLDWVWRTVATQEGDAVIFPLDAGDHTLTIAYREGFTPLDTLVVTSNTAYFPVHPVLEYFGDATTRNNQIWTSDWWGIFESNATLFPYLRHQKYGWVYCTGLSAFNGFWFWELTDNLGWCYTSTLLHPFIFNLQRGEWLYAYPGMNNYYFSYASQQAVQIGEVLNPYTADLVKEAEDGQLFGDFVIGSNPDASGGSFVHVPDGGNTGSTADDFVRLTFIVEEPGTYQIKTWVIAVKGEDNSFFVKVNGEPEGSGYLFDTVITETFTEDYVNARDVADPVQVYLDPGEVFVEFFQREDGAQLDKVELEKLN